MLPHLYRLGGYVYRLDNVLSTIYVLCRTRYEGVNALDPSFWVSKFGTDAMQGRP